MQYKTIILELIQEHPELYERLRSTKRLLPAVDAYAIELRDLHESWKDTIRQEEPGSDPIQIASEAMELAILGIHDGLLSASPKAETEPMPLDAAMEFLRRHTPPA